MYIPPFRFLLVLLSFFSCAPLAYAQSANDTTSSKLDKAFCDGVAPGTVQHVSFTPLMITGPNVGFNTTQTIISEQLLINDYLEVFTSLITDLSTRCLRADPAHVVPATDDVLNKVRAIYIDEKLDASAKFDKIASGFMVPNGVDFFVFGFIRVNKNYSFRLSLGAVSLLHHTFFTRSYSIAEGKIECFAIETHPRNIICPTVSKLLIDTGYTLINELAASSTTKP